LQDQEEEEEEDPLLEQYKDFLFAPDELPVYVAAPKVHPYHTRIPECTGYLMLPM
jgi:hypothetical protein